MKMPKSSVTLLWEPLVILIVGVLVVLINPRQPVLDAVTNVVGGLLLLASFSLLVIDTRQDLT
ncbi:MAG: hypothetical protein IT320_21730 [Anaerolineae bacterium]|nr:hypothetical protein [Anaerolineae bacterium]